MKSKITVRALFLAFTASALAGCASSTAWDESCFKRVITVHEPLPRQYVLTQHCAQWVYGPSRKQRNAFEALSREAAPAAEKD